jgi:ankyrin repeat protein
MTQINHGSGSQGLASDFYMACRTGNIDLVQRLLKTMEKEEVDKVEASNGSTALHAASFYGHVEVVRCLLNHGASRHIRNKYDNVPADEATNDTIKHMFQRLGNS